MWSRCGLGELRTTCVSPADGRGLASGDAATLQATMTAAFVVSEEEFYTAKLTGTLYRNSSIAQRVPRDVSMSAIKYLFMFSAHEWSQVRSSRGGVRFMLFYIVLSAFVNVKSKSACVFCNIICLFECVSLALMPDGGFGYSLHLVLCFYLTRS